MKSAAKNIQISSYEDLFKTEQERQADAQERVQNLLLEHLVPFPKHPFQVNDDDKMQELVESIRERGVLVPILVRPKENSEYEIVAGHRRHRASQLAGKTEIPAIVRDMDDDTAILLMVDSNLQRTDLTSSQLGMKLQRQSLDMIGEQTGDSRNTIHRYIRLTNLLPLLLDQVNQKKIAFNAAVEVSYLTEQEQQMLCEVIQREECTPSLNQARRLKKYSQDGKLDGNVIDVIMTEEKPIEEKLVLKGDVLARYFPRSYTPSQKQMVIEKLLEEWYRRQHRQQER